MTLANGTHDGGLYTDTPVVDKIKDIKHEAGHDINRMAKMIYELRQIVEVQYTKVGDYNVSIAELRKGAQEQTCILAETRANLHEAREAATNQSRIIENQQEEISNLHDTNRAMELRFTNQCQATTDIALQLTIARRDHAQAEQAHRETVQANASETARLHEALNTFDKVKSLGAKYRNETIKLLAENVELRIEANKRVIWKQLKARLIPRWFLDDNEEFNNG